MVRVIFCIVLVVLYSNSVAEESPFEVGILELVDKTIEHEDFHYATRASMRCATLYELSYQLLSKDSKQDPSQLSSLEGMIAVFIDSAYEMSGLDNMKDGELRLETESSLLKEYGIYIDMYGEWLNRNFVTQGEYFGSSELLLNEVKECAELSRILEFLDSP